MNTSKYIITALIASASLSACDSDLEKIVYDADEARPAQINAIPSEIILDAFAEGEEAVKLSWEKPDMGFKAEVSNNIEMDIAGKDFANCVLLASMKVGNEYSLTNAALNSKVMSLLEAYEMEIAPTIIEIRIVSSIANSVSPLYSNTISATVTPYAGEIEYPKIWVIGDYCGWSHQNSQFLFSFSNDNNYQGLVDFGGAAANGFKITGIDGWEDAYNWGASGSYQSESSSIQLISGGASGNIECYAKRFYHLTFDTDALILMNDLSFNTLTIVGEAGDEVSGWGGQEVEMSFDTAKQQFFADVTLSDGEIKFRTDHDWAYSLGVDGDGIISSAGGNIPVSAGQYRVYVNMNNASSMTYRLSASDFGK